MKALHTVVAAITISLCTLTFSKATFAQFCTGSTDDHVFYIDTTQHVDELCQSQSTGAWKLSLSNTGAQAAGGLVSFYANGQEHVAYVSFSNTTQIDQLYLSAGTWLNQNITAAAGAPNNATGLTGYVDGSTESLFYLTPAGHVIQLTSTNGTSWQFSDLITLTGAPVAVLGSGLTSYVANVQAVIYRSSADHIIQLFNNGSWHFSDLTSIAGASESTGGFASDYDAVHEVQNVYYLIPSRAHGVDEVLRLFETVSCDCWSVGEFNGGTVAGANLASYTQGSGTSETDNVFFTEVNTTEIFDGNSEFSGGPTVSGAPMTGWPETNDGVIFATLVYSIDSSSGEELLWQFGALGPAAQLTGTGGVVSQAPTPELGTPLTSFVGP